MKYNDLRDFLAQLERDGEVKRIAVEVDPRLEMTEICDRVLKAAGPALLFEAPKGHSIPVLCNLFGTSGRVATHTRLPHATIDILSRPPMKIGQRYAEITGASR